MSDRSHLMSGHTQPPHIPHLYERAGRYLSTTPVALVLTGATAVLAAYITLRREFLAPIVLRWSGLGDFGDFVIYCLAVVGILSILIWVGARRYVLAIVGGIWTTTLFGPGAVVTVCAIGLAAYLLGLVILSRAGINSGADVAPPLALALGYAILLGVFQLVVLFRIYTKALVLVVLATVICTLSRRYIGGDSRRLAAWFQEPMTKSLTGWLAILPATIGAVQLVYASFAETHSDALTVHLMIPHQILLTGTWSFDAVTYNFATMPKGASWLFAAHYLLAGETAARLFNLVTTWVTAWLVFAVVRRHTGTEAGTVLATVFLSAPLTFWCVFVMFEDALLTLFTTAAVVVLALAWSRLTPSAAALVALALAAGMATKMQGLLLAVPIGLTLCVGLVRTRSLRTVGLAMLQMAIPALVIGAVPYVIGWLVTANPLFPFYNAVFHSPLFPDMNFVDDRWIGKASATLLYGLTFQTSRFMEGINGGFGLQHFLLVPGVLAASLLVRRPEVLIPAFCGAGIFVVVCYLTQYARYLYPTFPLLAMAAAALWHRASAERWRPALVLGLCGLVVLNVFAYRSINYLYYFFPPNPFAAQARPQPAYPVERTFNSIINITHGRAARVLYLERAFGAGLDGTPLYAIAPHLNSRLYAAATAVRDVQSLKNLLEQNSVTHVMSDDQVTPLGHPGFQEHLPKVATLQAHIGSVKLWRVLPGDAQPGGRAER
jgi:dolichyl-phosphate-mannose-protein mannosyltransferase